MGTISLLLGMGRLLVGGSGTPFVNLTEVDYTIRNDPAHYTVRGPQMHYTLKSKPINYTVSGAN